MLPVMLEQSRSTVSPCKDAAKEAEAADGKVQDAEFSRDHASNFFMLSMLTLCIALSVAELWQCLCITL